MRRTQYPGTPDGLSAQAVADTHTHTLSLSLSLSLSNRECPSACRSAPRDKERTELQEIDLLGRGGRNRAGRLLDTTHVLECSRDCTSVLMCRSSQARKRRDQWSRNDER
jgi:hypothetical protein